LTMSIFHEALNILYMYRPNIHAYTGISGSNVTFYCFCYVYKNKKCIRSRSQSAIVTETT